MNKKKSWKIAEILLAVALVLTFLPIQPAQAASKKAQALSAYKRKLSQSTVVVVPKGTKVWQWSDNPGEWKPYNSSNSKNVRFTTAYINNDTIPELVLWDSGSDLFGVWTYRNGKVVCVMYDSLGKPTGYYKKKGILRGQTDSRRWWSFDRWYRQGSKNGGQVLEIEHDYYDYGDDSYLNGGRLTYFIGTKQVSKASFNKKLKSYVGSTGLSRFSFRANTKSNRAHYLK